MDTTLADRVKAAIDEALAISSPAERARELTQIYGVITNVAPHIRQVRRQDVLTMKATMTYKDIGETLGMTRGRAEQIAKGK